MDFYDEVNSRLIQVTRASDKVDEREIRGIVKAESLVQAKELLIVTYDVEGVERREGREIRMIPIYKFLLMG
nr:ATP-binding protein [Metallosphaera hakonensis]